MIYAFFSSKCESIIIERHLLDKKMMIFDINETVIVFHELAFISALKNIEIQIKSNEE
ncbi:MAG: hypothetical protein KJ971_06365 [Firmicutes bacterium]|nr:hypothetical protein [Bacillota bacterium]